MRLIFFLWCSWELDFGCGGLDSLDIHKLEIDSTTDYASIALKAWYHSEQKVSLHVAEASPVDHGAGVSNGIPFGFGIA